MSTIVDQDHFLCQENGSNKEYHIELVREDNGSFSVPTRYGAVGGGMQTGSKGAGLTEAAARKAFDREVAKRFTKGYHRFGAPTPQYTPGNATDVQTEFRPQLLNMITEQRLEELLRDDDYIMQLKKDGRNISIMKTAVETVAINKKGKVVSAPQRVIDAVNTIPRDVLLGGEMIGETYYSFDMIGFGNPNTMKDKGFGQRLAGLLKVCAVAGFGLDRADSDHPIKMVPGWQTEREKRNVLANARASLEEGVVFKKADALYTPGRPASGGPQLKYKFKAQATVRVGENATGKRSVHILCESDRREARNVGKVTIPPNFGVPPVGALVEVEYLYCHIGGKIFQAVYLGERDDQDKADTYESLKFKQAVEEDEEEG
jgi:bifunctional non-homologous end joining protein LigD